MTTSVLLGRFNPDRQAWCARNPMQCLTADVPTLHDVRRLYGADAVRSWLDIQLTDLAMFAGVKKGDAAPQIRSLVQVIADNYGYLKLSELLLFFQHFKSGRYGRFYGQFDPMVVTDALYGFQTYRLEVLSAVERRAERDRRDRAREERRRMEASGELMSREEWEELRWLFNM